MLIGSLWVLFQLETQSIHPMLGSSLASIIAEKAGLLANTAIERRRYTIP